VLREKTIAGMEVDESRAEELMDASPSAHRHRSHTAHRYAKAAAS